MFGLKRRSGRIRRLEEALQWYADESHWRRKATNPKGSPRRWAKSAAARDRGGRARIALDDGWVGIVWKFVADVVGAEAIPSTPITVPPPRAADYTGTARSDDTE